MSISKKDWESYKKPTEEKMDALIKLLREKEEMQMVQRWNTTDFYGHMDKAMEGDYILYTDHLADKEAAVKTAKMEGLNEAWDLAHEPANCGHARANWKDPKYGTPEYKGEEKCEVCEQIATITDELECYKLNPDEAAKHIMEWQKRSFEFEDENATLKDAERCHMWLVSICHLFRQIVRGRRLTMDLHPERRKEMSGIEMMQQMYDSELTFSISSDCWDGGFTVKVGAQDPYGEKWVLTESGIDGVEFALAKLLDMVLKHYPESKFTKEIEGKTVVYLREAAYGPTPRE